MKADTSFSQKIKEGWTKERLMAYYVLTDREYDRVIACLAEMRAQVKQA